jgi:CubicO group peptidase (beta-lactamase class C family)
MTATLCAILVEEGKLDWNSTPAAVWPQFADKFHPDFRNLTLAQFLHHRAGLPSDTAIDDVWRAMRQFRGTPQSARLQLVQLALSKAPATPPDSRYVYSNSGYTIAGAMCEKVTGTPYEILIKQRLFDPLGMKSAGFGAPAAPNQPRGHNQSGKPVEPGPTADNPDAYSPSGRAHMSIADWGKFISLHLQGAKGNTKLLKKESFDFLHRPAEGEGLPYAGGWIVARRPWAGGVALSHAGTNNSWYCVTWLAPENGFAVLVACNSGNDNANQATDQAASALIQRYLETAPR